MPGAFLLLSPSAKWLQLDVTMHAVHFWGQGRGLPAGRESYLWLKKRVCERENEKIEKKHKHTTPTSYLLKLHAKWRHVGASLPNDFPQKKQLYMSRKGPVVGKGMLDFVEDLS